MLTLHRYATVYTHTHIHKDSRTHTQIHTLVYVLRPMYVPRHTHTHTHTHTRMHAWACLYWHPTCLHASPHVCNSVCVCADVCLCVCVMCTGAKCARQWRPADHHSSVIHVAAVHCRGRFHTHTHTHTTVVHTHMMPVSHTCTLEDSTRTVVYMCAHACATNST